MSNLKVNSINDLSGGSNAVLYGVAAPTNSMGFRNRIINGDMRIDQRNAGASVGFNTSSNFGVDRFKTYNTVGSGSTVQRSTTAPAGFSNSLLFTVGTGASPSASSECIFFQPIEGFNVSDLGFGTASASSVTVSFQVRSSVTGTYAFRLRNQAGNRSYVATYTVNAANTWETKSVTIAGDTSGTWATDNTIGILLTFDLGSGSDYNTTAGAWQAGSYTRTSGCVNFIATSGATFYITGVQLEAGSVASPFERRDYGRELMMCQRYYEAFYGTNSGSQFVGMQRSSVSFWAEWFFTTNKRSSPTVSITSAGSWPEATPTFYPGVKSVQLSAGSQFYLGGAGGAAVLQASSEL
jgi:hypothetical protein